MEDVLCNISAFRYYRVPPQVFSVLPMLPERVDDPMFGALVGHPLVTEALGTPLHVLSDKRSRNLQGNRLVRHFSSAELPFGSILETDFCFDVSSPLFTLLSLAPYVSNERLIMMMYEFCGSFSVFRVSSKLKSIMLETRGKKAFDPMLGWSKANPSDASDSLWKRPPLITVDELKDFSHEVSGLRGAKSFVRAAKCVTGVAASPLEVQTSMLLSLPRVRGGEGISIENNVKVALDYGAQLISNTESRVVDILAKNRDDSKECDIECQGTAFHGSVESKIADSDRTTALQSMGRDVILTTYGQISDVDAFAEVVKLICTKLNMPYKEKSALQKQREAVLREQIFVNLERF